MTDYFPLEDDQIGIDPREEFRILKRYGFRWVGLKRADYSIPCACRRFSDKGVKPSSMCRRCLNTGFPFVDYLVSGRIWESGLGVSYQATPGMISTSSVNFVVDHRQSLRKGDIVCELYLDADTGLPVQPFQVRKYYRIAGAEPKTADNGKLIFWKARLEEMSVDDGRMGEVKQEVVANE